MEFVKFVFKFFNNMLPRYFNYYFRSLKTKAKKDFFHTYQFIIYQSIYFTRRVTAGWSQRKTTRVMKVCYTNGIYLQIKTQNNFKLQHRYLIIVQAYIKSQKKEDAGNPSIWRNKMHASSLETILNKSNANSDYAIYNTPISKR